MIAFRNVVGALVVTLFSNPASAQDLEFALINMSGYTLVEFYTSPENVGSWEEDVLGNDVLESGYSLNITVADGRTQCVYDMLMVFDDGDRLEDTVNMCEMGSYTIE